MLMTKPGVNRDLYDFVDEGGKDNCHIDSFLSLVGSLNGNKFVKDDTGDVKYLTGGPVSPLLIEYALKGSRLAGNVISFVETDSTNDIAWNYCGKPDSLGMVVLAESQRKGRGRFTDRKWYDQKGESVLMSILVNNTVVAPDVLGIAAAIAIVESVREICGLAVTIKWPNDVVYGRNKLAGLMVEARTIEGQEWYVLGIGLNCNQSSSDMPEDIARKATSIMIETNKKVDRDWLIINILDKLDT
ncbi:MAG: biotin--[acetyl-CoA-carboxylase] ligase, partial [Sedimentisphaerales bacterium]|nr:biotin--[acetyl-CoA-carboxylase] ligase [Sedimentisphaerales bacterium]